MEAELRFCCLVRVVGVGREEVGFVRGSLTVGQARQVAGCVVLEPRRVPVQRVVPGILIYR